MACQSSTGWDGRTRRPAARAPLNRLLVGWEESSPRPDGIGYFSKASSYSHTFADYANVWAPGVGFLVIRPVHNNYVENINHSA